MNNLAKQLYTTAFNFTLITNESVIEAQERFKEYQKMGVIMNDSTFNSSVWRTTDEYSNFYFRFDLSRSAYTLYRDIFDMDYNSFIVRLKVYLLSLFGKNVLSTIQYVLLDIKHIIGTAPNDVCGLTDELKLHSPRLCSSFFLLLSVDNEPAEKLVDAMDSYADLRSMQDTRQRTLAEMDTYFHFNDIINEYWQSDISNKDRMFYYPLYLWWNLTAVLPLRPREFLLIKRDCLEKRENKYYLTIRRNKLKGSGRTITYKLDSDYNDEKYCIPAKLGEEIERYITLTENCEPSEIGTLFVRDPHYTKLRLPQSIQAKGYFSYGNMYTVLRSFYAEVISGIYGLSVLYDNPERHLLDNELQFIHLGDTRHIALINLMQEGGTPVTAMLLAGHDGANMAAHYYSNISNLIECRTYRQYRKMITGDVHYKLSGTVSIPGLSKYEGVNLEDGGICLSSTFAEGDIADCIKVIGSNGEIGYCPDCKFYRNYRAKDFCEEDMYKGQLFADCKMLADTVSLVRQGKGCTEDLGEVFMRLNASSRSYQDYLYHKKLKEGMEEDGETENNR